MRNIKISPIESLDMLNFKLLSSKRKKMIDSGSSNPLPKDYNTNLVAKALHPGKMKVRVKEIIEETKNIKTIVLASLDDSSLPNFKAGQYINVSVKIGDSIISRPYSIASSPRMAREGEYRITVKATGIVSDYITNNLKVADEIEISEPSGNFYYSPIRDQRKIIGVAGGIGVTPFYSLALAILDGEEDVELTLYYAVKKESDLIFKEKFDDIVAKTNKVKVVYVLSEENNEQYKYGLVTMDLVKPELYEAVSFFIAGPKDMIIYLNEEFLNLKLPKKYFRYENFSNTPIENDFNTYNLTVVMKDENVVIPCQSNETLLTAMERAGIKAPSNCHVGSCGFCRSKLVSGEVKMMTDKRRESDKKYNFVHPCCSYPLSDCKIKINA